MPRRLIGQSKPQHLPGKTICRGHMLEDSNHRKSFSVPALSGRISRMMKKMISSKLQALEPVSNLLTRTCSARALSIISILRISALWSAASKKSRSAALLAQASTCLRIGWTWLVRSTFPKFQRISRRLLGATTPLTKTWSTCRVPRTTSRTLARRWLKSLVTRSHSEPIPSGSPPLTMECLEPEHTNFRTRARSKTRSSSLQVIGPRWRKA